MTSTRSKVRSANYSHVKRTWPTTLERDVNEALFMQEIDNWLADVRVECVRLFDIGCASERVLGIATAIADAKAMKRVVSRQQLSGAAAAPFRRLPNQ